jgi:hypothetical protein
MASCSVLKDMISRRYGKVRSMRLVLGQCGVVWYGLASSAVEDE